MNFKVWFCFAVSLIVGAVAECPVSLVEPCTCQSNAITCQGENITDSVLVKLFDDLSKHLSNNNKHFAGLTLTNTNITGLKQRAFGDITFDDIMILRNPNLRHIDDLAFYITELKTKSINFLFNDGLTQSAHTYFNILSRFLNLEKLYIDWNGINITEIPANAFQPINGYQNHLKSITIMRSAITKIGTRAFYNLRNLETLSFFRTDLTQISDFAFEFELPSDKPLTLSLDWSYKLKPTSFSPKSLMSIRRPTNITMRYQSAYDFPYMDKNVFLPFVIENDKNYLEYVQVKLDCTDCRNAWLKKYSNVIKKNFEWMCDWTTGIIFDDPNTFANCN